MSRDNNVLFLLLVVLVSVTGQYVESQCSNITMVTRSEWNARPPVTIDNMPTPVGMVFIHHTAMDYCYTLPSCSAQMRNIQNFHMDTRGWFDIGYNFLVGEDGRVYEARGWDREGAHTKGYNRVAVAISVMGDFTNRIPNKKALDAVHDILNCGVSLGKLLPNYNLYGHRDVRPTTCPGDSFYALIETWPHFDHNKPVKPTGSIIG